MKSEREYRSLSEEPKKIFVSEDGMATIICPNCGQTKQVSVADYIDTHKSIKVRCKCEQKFKVDLEFRQQHRKKTNLNGIYDIASETGGGRAEIKDVSLSGIGFTVSGVHNVRVGQKIQIEFMLDDSKQTKLNKTAVVRSVSDNRIGCEFQKENAFEKDLGFYLSQ